MCTTGVWGVSGLWPEWGGRLLGEVGVEDRAELGGTGGGKGIMPASLWEVLLKWLLTSLQDLNKVRTNIRGFRSNKKNLLLFIFLPWLENISYLKKCLPLC